MSKILRTIFKILVVIITMYMIYSVYSTVYNFKYSNKLTITKQIVGGENEQFQIVHFTEVEMAPKFSNIPNIFSTMIYSKQYLWDANELSRANNGDSYIDAFYKNVGTNINCTVYKKDDVTVFHYSRIGVTISGEKQIIDKVIICKFSSSVNIAVDEVLSLI